MTKIINIVTAFLFLLGMTNNIQNTPLNNGLIAYWKLDEIDGTRLDSLNICNGTVGCDLYPTNTVGSTLGKIGNAALFVSTNSSYLSAVDNPNLSYNGDFTVTAWIKLTSKPTTNMYWGGRYYGATNREFSMGWRQSVDRFRMSVYDSSGNTTGETLANSFGPPSIDTWYWVVISYVASSRTLGISVDNGPTDIGITTTDIVDGISPFFIGQLSNFFWNGAVDEVGYWKRILSPIEKTELYNNGVGCTYPFTVCEPTTPTPLPAPTQTPIPINCQTVILKLNNGEIINVYNTPTGPC